MLKRDFFRKCALLVAAALLVVAISSCSQERSLVLCNIKLDVEDTSRSFDDVVFDTTLSSSSYTLYYSTVYKGSDKSCYGVFSNQEYDSKVGILLSQGRWEITCAWKDAYGNTVATGTTNDIWVNLNTSSFKVYLDENGKGSAKLNYEVFKAVVANVTNAVTDVKVDLTLSKWNGSAFDVKNNVNGLEGTQGTEENSIKIYNQSFEDLDSGKYLLVIQAIDNTPPQTSESILFTDVIGFVVKPGHTTVVNGSCEVINGVSGKNEYITWEPNPGNPSTENGTIINAGNNSGQTDLTNSETEIAGKVIIIIQEDTNGTTEGSMTLGGYGKDNNETRIVEPAANANFGINMNGTDVLLSTYEPTDIGDAADNSEKTTIVKLPTSTEMTLYNYVKNGESSTANTWGLIPEVGFKRRYNANAKVCGGTLNVVGPNGKPNSISNIPIVFQGPAWDDNNILESGGVNYYKKQGAINLSSPGGTVVLDGNVTVKGCVGISSWDKIKYFSKGFDPSLTGVTHSTITMKNGASIEALGDGGDYPDTAYGIYLKYTKSNSSSTLDIILDNAKITTSNKDKYNPSDEVGIYIDSFKGTMNITLRNGAEISTSGTAIKLNNCSGTINIEVEEGCTITAPTQLNKNGDTSVNLI